MFNLIPDTLKEKIARDYKERRIILLLFSFICFIAMLFIFISPSFGYLFFEEKDVAAEAEVMMQSDQFKKADEVVTSIKETNEHLRVLSLEVRSVSPIEAIEKIVETKRQAIHITEIQYKETTATSSTIILQGKADRREALKDFVSSLQNLSGFSDVVLPVSNFAKDKDISFTISMKIL